MSKRNTRIGGGRGIAPLILQLGTGWWWVVNFMLRQVNSLRRTPVPTEWKAVWAPEPVWMFWTIDKTLPSTEIRTPVPSGPQPSRYTDHGIPIPYMFII
jgi:hypothetical protein